VVSDSPVPRRSDSGRTWPWFVLGLIVLATVLAMIMLPRSSGDDEVGERGPSARPQSDTRPMPPPAVARTRGLAA
jgi:hypothetical protein